MLKEHNLVDKINNNKFHVNQLYTQIELAILIIIFYIKLHFSYIPDNKYKKINIIWYFLYFISCYAIYSTMMIVSYIQFLSLFFGDIFKIYILKKSPWKVF
jgi:hypothetical protein